MRKILPITVSLFILMSCTTAKQSQSISKRPEVMLSFELKEGLLAPESVIYDHDKELIYVSNVNGDAATKDGNGYILSCDLEGNIVEEKMVTGLNAPKGMAIYNNNLYVSDINTLVKIDLTSNSIIAKYEEENGQFFNDVAINSNGDVFVTDTWANKIYILQGDNLEIYTDNTMLDNPNGITFNNDKLFLVSWSKPAEGAQGSFKEIAENGSTVKRISESIEGLDGIEVISDNEYFVTNYLSGSLYYVENGVFNPLFSTTMGTADLEYIKERQLILIPQMSLNELAFYSVKL